MNFFYLILLLVTLISCSKDSNYVYKESGIRNGLTINEDVEIIVATNDTIAYLKGFEKFYISEYVYEYSKDKFSSSITRPLSFEILNSDSLDIVINFQYLMISQEDSIRENISKMNHSFVY